VSLVLCQGSSPIQAATTLIHTNVLPLRQTGNISKCIDNGRNQPQLRQTGNISKCIDNGMEEITGNAVKIDADGDGRIATNCPEVSSNVWVLMSIA